MRLKVVRNNRTGDIEFAGVIEIPELNKLHFNNFDELLLKLRTGSTQASVILSTLSMVFQRYEDQQMRKEI